MAVYIYHYEFLLESQTIEDDALTEDITVEADNQDEARELSLEELKYLHPDISEIGYWELVEWKDKSKSFTMLSAYY